MSKHKTDPQKTTIIDGKTYNISLLKKEELPLELPNIENFEPTKDGRSPLANTDWIDIKDDQGNIIAKREADTMPTWAGSSWYYLRFTDPHNHEEFASQENLKYWLPVDHYFGGNEHTTVHLLYSRFWHKVLYELGHVPTPEPYLNRTNGGILLADDGTKMSKSKGNVINPDDKLDEVGADALRLYINFIGPYEATVVWQDGGLIACKRVVDNMFKLSDKVISNTKAIEKAQLSTYHQMLKKITELLDNRKNNVAVAEIMTFVNYLKSIESIPGDIWTGFLQVVAPFMPHITEELWYLYYKYDQNDYTKSIHLSNWPVYNPEFTKTDTVTIAVQINGKIRLNFDCVSDIEDNQVLEIAVEKSAKWLESKTIKFSKVIKNKLVSIVAE